MDQLKSYVVVLGVIIGIVAADDIYDQIIGQTSDKPTLEQVSVLDPKQSEFDCGLSTDTADL